jgi:DNA polymerase III alpha subunit
MHTDKYNNIIFNDADIFHYLYSGDISALPKLLTSPSDEISKLTDITGINFKEYIKPITTIEEFDKKNQEHWFMPDEYYDFNVKQFCLKQCRSLAEIKRVSDELQEYERLNLTRLLQWLKYFVDTCQDSEVLLGVGRGSSVASYVLYLLGVHRINSIKYDLDWKEFLR